MLSLAIGIQNRKKRSAANTRYTRHTTDYRQTYGLVMLPFRSVLCFVGLFVAQPSTTIDRLHASEDYKCDGKKNITFDLRPGLQPQGQGQPCRKIKHC